MHPSEAQHTTPKKGPDLDSIAMQLLFRTKFATCFTLPASTSPRVHARSPLLLHGSTCTDLVTSLQLVQRKPYAVHRSLPNQKPTKCISRVRGKDRKRNSTQTATVASLPISSASVFRRDLVQNWILTQSGVDVAFQRVDPLR